MASLIGLIGMIGLIGLIGMIVGRGVPQITKRDRGAESLPKLARAFGDPICFALTPREFIMFCPALFAQ
jgi:hypothetical protein